MTKMLALTQGFNLITVISVPTGRILAADICGISRRLRTLYTSHAARATLVDGCPAITCPILSHGDGIRNVLVVSAAFELYIQFMSDILVPLTTIDILGHCRRQMCSPPSCAPHTLLIVVPICVQ